MAQPKTLTADEAAALQAKADDAEKALQTKTQEADEAAKALEERDARIAELEQAKADDAEKDDELGPVGEYVVLSAGVSYFLPGKETAVGLAVRSRVVSLTADEAGRLLRLGAIAAASDADREREALIRGREILDAQVAAPEGPAGNPYGGRALESLQEHAAKEIAKATEAAAK